jgi:hypothetical protein
MQNVTENFYDYRLSKINQHKGYMEFYYMVEEKTHEKF